MKKNIDETKIAILKVLNEMNEASGAARITERLSYSGINLKPRTIRFYLLQLDHEGLTSFVSKRRGRVITEKGREELSHFHIIEKVGVISARVDVLGYKMSLSLRTKDGTIIPNIAVIHKKDLTRAMKEMSFVFEKNLCVGKKLAIIHSGEKIADFVIPEDSVALATVCSLTVNGVLLSHGIPVTSRFGGLLEMKNGEPVRFYDLIEYRGTTIDPLEVFTRAGMTSVSQCARTGYGIVGASFREIPSAAMDEVKRIRKEIQHEGLASILLFGRPNQPLLDIPVSEGRTGMIVIGGLNPFAALHERGIPITLHPIAGLEDISIFSTFQELYKKYQ